MLKNQVQFSLQELKSIFEDYLNLYMYYQALSSILLQHQLSIKLYPLKIIQQSLKSKQFIEKVPPYINSLLTTTNIGIIVETLKIVGSLQFPIQKAKVLKRIKQSINILTLYQIQKNITYIMCDLSTINDIIQNIGIIASENQFEYYKNHIWPYQTIPSTRTRVIQIYHLLQLCVYTSTIQKMKKQLVTLLFKENQNQSENKEDQLHPQKTVKTVDFKENDDNMRKINIQCLKSGELLSELEEARKKYKISKRDTQQSKNGAQKNNLTIMILDLIKNGKMAQKKENQIERFLSLNGQKVKNDLISQVNSGKVLIVDDYDTAKQVYHPRKNITMRKILSSKFLSKQSNIHKKKCVKEDFMNLGQKIFKKYKLN